MKLPKFNIKTINLTLLIIAMAGYSVSWDLRRLDEDFNHLYSLLKTTRWDAFYKDTIIVVRFNGNVVTVTNQKDSKNMTIAIPMIAKVDYDTTIGKSMIVYDEHGTGEYNKKVHGGEIMLKSLLGFKRYIHVNCNGFVTEGRYPEEEIRNG